MQLQIAFRGSVCAPKVFSSDYDKVPGSETRSQSISAPAKSGAPLQARSGSISGAPLRVALRPRIRSVAPASAPALERCAPTALRQNFFHVHYAIGGGSHSTKIMGLSHLSKLRSRHLPPFQKYPLRVSDFYVPKGKSEQSFIKQ